MSGQTPASTPQQQADALVFGGVTITSTSTPALNGTYACEGNGMPALQAEVNAILLSAGANFADGTTSLNWPDRNGTPHAFDVAQFHALAGAVGNIVAGAYLYARGAWTTLPSNTATIP